MINIGSTEQLIQTKHVHDVCLCIKEKINIVLNKKNKFFPHVQDEFDFKRFKSFKTMAS